MDKEQNLCFGRRLYIKGIYLNWSRGKQLIFSPEHLKVSARGVVMETSRLLGTKILAT